ncbi:MLX-interacting protein [Protopterus annectens]|uniref:MLX-interacting protein n=1 Tax=Protopterus annectens TaxID=7888 RepID=UPI001CF99DC8|nr:MLX-interacting protein [Protopterus annectens]
MSNNVLVPSYRVRSLIKQEPDDDSDTDEPNVLQKKSDSDETQIIHSGHFMVSSPHSEHPPKKGYDFDTVNRQTCQTYTFGKTSTFSIDVSLTKLFECMSLAYSGKLVSPKWKNFKGLKLLRRDKIRLNNAIWRAWYMQYLEKRKNPVCHFVTPLDGSVDVDEHRRPEAIATEGKYWKRRIEVVIREYHKWRTYFKKRLQKRKDEDLSILVKDDDFWIPSRSGRETPVPMEQDHHFDMDMLMSEFTDTLFSSHQSVSWLNPRELAHSGNADMIQPGLSPLQPNLDFVDTFEDFQNFFSSSRYPLGNIFSSGSTSIATVAPLTGNESLSQSASLSANTLSVTVPPVNLDEELIPSPGPSPTISGGASSLCEESPDVSAYIQAQRFSSEDSLVSRQTFTGMVPVPLPAVQTSVTQHRTASPAVPQITSLNSQTAFASPEVQKFGFDSPLKSSVITHTASDTLTCNAAATTFSQSQNLVLASQHQGVPCNLSVQSGLMQQKPPVQPQSQLTFTVPTPPQTVPPSNSRTRLKSQKTVLAPKPEGVSILVNSAFIAPGGYQGQPRTVIVTPVPLKGEGMLTSTIPQSSVVMARATGLTDFPSSILVGTATNSQCTHPPVHHVFPASTVPSTVAKGEPATLHSCSRTDLPSSQSTERRNSGQGSPIAFEPAASQHSPPNSCSGKIKTDSQNASVTIRRITHISAEQKRRFNIRRGFSTLQSLVTTMKSNSKPVSNACTLQKTVEYIAKLQQERIQMQDDVKRLREEIEELNATISSCQLQLPATGVPITRQNLDHMQEMFDAYVKNRTLQNWKFWIFSIIISPLFESFNKVVSTVCINDLCQSTLSWLDQYCSLPVLRPTVLNTLRKLSTTTSILTDPSLLPEQATQAVNQIGTSGNP